MVQIKKLKEQANNILRGMRAATVERVPAAFGRESIKQLLAAIIPDIKLDFNYSVSKKKRADGEPSITCG